MFSRCRFQNVPIRVPFSKSTVFKICRQKMCGFRVNRRPIRRIFHRFQNVPASCERSLNLVILAARINEALTASKLPDEIGLTVAFILHMKKKEMILM